MADYGITNYADENTLGIRQPHCATFVRVKEETNERIVRETFWHVELSDGGVWQTVYSFDDENSAVDARNRLAEFINQQASKEVYS